MFHYVACFFYFCVCDDGLTELRVLHLSGMAEFKMAMKQSHLAVGQTHLLIEPATVRCVTSLVCEVTRCVSSGHYSFERSSRSSAGCPRGQVRGAEVHSPSAFCVHLPFYPS